MAKYGLPGAVYVNNKEIAYMQNWQLEQTVEIKEGSYFRGSGKEKTVGISDWSASFSGRVNFEDETNQQELVRAFKAGEKISLMLYLNQTTGFEGEGFIESLKIDNSAEGEYNIEISIAGDGGTEYKSTESSD